MSETTHVGEMLQRAFAGNAWHGPGLRRLLGEVTAEQAAAHPVRGARSIWETAFHVAILEDLARRRLEGEKVPVLEEDESWPRVPDATPEAWHRTLQCVDSIHQALCRVLERFPEQRLGEVVPGRDYPYYVIVHGLAQHELSVAHFYRRDKRWQGVVGRLETVVKEFPKLGFDAEALFGLHEAYAALGRQEEAKQALRRLIQLQPDTDEAKKARRMLGEG